MSRRKPSPHLVVPVIDLFAGPGGLGEGFSRHTGSGVRFQLALSIEMERWAHETLRLRAFYRHGLQTRSKAVTSEYFKLMQHGVSKTSFESLQKHDAPEVREAAEAAAQESIRLTLGGSTIASALKRISQALSPYPQHPWVLIGGPPCQAYSLVGRSRRIRQPGYSPEADPRQTLYLEYLRVLAAFQPDVFIMENVKGLLSATLGDTGIFKRILRDLERPRSAVAEGHTELDDTQDDLAYDIYPVARSTAADLFPGAAGQRDPRSYLVKSERYGVPQARHRIILLGVRRNSALGIPEPLPEEGGEVSVKQALKGLPRLRSGITRSTNTDAEWHDWLQAAGGSDWLPQVSSDVRKVIKAIIRQPSIPHLGQGTPFIAAPRGGQSRGRWRHNSAPGGIHGHVARAHMKEDLHRYLFAAAFASVKKRSPELSEFPKGLLPEHRNVTRALSGGHFSDRFRVQVADRPATTVTSHIAKDGHYYIHHDPAQCRSLTVREAARLQTFPDDYLFAGPRTSQYHQVGNAVPPRLARQIAGIVARLLQPRDR